jgi:xanthine/CO dehydrogenase XdhC/CoxF family maturation factor
MGLDSGALTPEEIAISITAELIAVRRGADKVKHKSVIVESAAAAPVQSERSS